MLTLGKLTIKSETLWQFRKAKVVRAGTVAPSHLLLKFGKLTIKFDMLCKKLKVRSFKTSAGRWADSGAGGCGAALPA